MNMTTDKDTHRNWQIDAKLARPMGAQRIA
jgi:hypothetical protein